MVPQSSGITSSSVDFHWPAFREWAAFIVPLCSGVTDYPAEGSGGIPVRKNNSPIFSFISEQDRVGDDYVKSIFLSSSKEVSKIYDVVYQKTYYVDTFYKNRFNEFGYLFPLSSITAQNITAQHMAYIKYENKKPTVIYNKVIVDEVDITDSLANALGIETTSLLGVIYTVGI